MYLKTIDIQGFKSFPDKITIRLNNGITAIVGPNGSGKSNICDAIRWVLGEQSSRALRGSKMEDVIFNGTKNRASVGFCEVSLTLDNSSSFLASPYEEVTITRRYYRSGESEYYINRSPVRLKDIHELLMDTGLGRDGYSVIGQGKIAEILSVKSEDRRQVFEEAAGISKFRYRKEESEKKLRLTEDNLSRAQDIITELESRLEPLSVQSKKAIRFLSLREELKEQEVNSWLFSLDRTRTELSDIENKVLIAKNTLDFNKKEADDTDTEIENLYQQIRDKDIASEKIKEEIYELQNNISDYKSSLSIMQNTIDNNSNTIDRLREEASASLSAKDEIECKINSLHEDITSLKTDLLTRNKDLETLCTSGKSLQAKDEDMQIRLQELKIKYASAADNISKLQIDLSAARAESTALSDKSVREENDLSSKERALFDVQNSLNEIEKQVSDSDEKLLSFKNQLDGYDNLLSARNEKYSAVSKDAEQKQHQLYKKRTRLSMLQDMERDFEGFNHSVKSVMQASSRGRLNGIHAPLSTLLSMEENLSLAIETALGAAVQNIVADNENSAKSAISYLKSRKLGRATFLPLSSIRGRTLSEKGLEKHHGFLGFASSLVKFDEKYREVVLSLLGRTAVTETIDDAVALAKAYNHRFKIVTLDGQVINAGGSMTGGSAPRTIGVFSRKNELTRLIKETQKEEKELAETEKKLSILKGEITNTDGLRNRCLIEITEEKQKSAVLSARKEAACQDTSRLKKEICLLKDGLSNGKETLEKLKRLIDEKNTLLSAAQEELLEIQKNEDTLSGESSNLQKERNDLTEKITSIRLNINSIEKDIEAKNNAANELISQKESISLSNKNKETEIETLKTKNLELSDNIITKKELIRLNEQSIQTKTVSVTDLGKQKQSLEEMINKRQKDAKEQRNRLLDLQKEYARLENSLNSLRHEEESLASRLWEVYELTLSAAEKYRKKIENISAVNRDISRLKSEIKSLGNINIDAIEEYKEVKERYDFLCAQRDDLLTAKQDLLKLIDDMTSHMKSIFSKQFKVINEAFCKSFSELFGGGSASVSLADPGDVLGSGIEIKVQPPGKNVKSLSLLSGGEQAFTAIALVFAILKVRPTPFCVFDEIEAALDDVNVFRFANYLIKFENTIQFIVITHRRGTMEAADLLYGVTMQEQGVSKMLAINVAEVEEKLNIK